jgi:tetratricopeptide (TPR) repeat protein
MTLQDTINAEFDAGVTAHQGNHPDDAEMHYRRVLELNPEHAAAWNNLGCLLENHRQQQREAEACYRQSLRARPGNGDALCNLGWLLHCAARLDEAQACYQQALEHCPDRAILHNNLGALLVKKGCLPDAQACFQRALAIDPALAVARRNLAALLRTMLRYDDAVAAYHELLAHEPDSAEILTLLGAALLDARRFTEAEQVLRRALELQPGRLPAAFVLSLVLFTVGRLEEAWPLYESRHGESPDWGDAAAFRRRPALPFREWQGGPLAGKSLVVWPEQGNGDVIQFARYLPMLKARGLSRLTLVCSAGLCRLLESVKGVDECIAADDEQRISAAQIPAHDYACMMLSLPLRFGTTLHNIPDNVPYVKIAPSLVAHWKARLPSGGFKVGLVWAGDPRPHQADANAVDQRRSLHATAYLPLLRLPGITFVSLQKSAATRAQMLELPEALRPLDPMEDVGDFADTGAIIENLDLVITVDTSIAHLAGALNKPVWILSRFDGCWRWLVDRDDSPWYPSARLFRQVQPGDWSAPLEQVLRELQALAGRQAR